ncbi:MAG: protein translocase subunit SecF [Clostridia bacterium]
MSKQKELNTLTKKKGLTDRYMIWLIIPLIIIVIAAAVFTGFAVSYKDISKGINIGIDFAGGSVITVTLGEEQIGTNEGYNKHLAIIKKAIVDEAIAKSVVEYATTKGLTVPQNVTVGSISYTQKSDVGESMSIIVKYDNISSTYDPDNIVTAERNKLIVDNLKKTYDDENGYNGVIVTTSNIGATASTNLIITALLAVGITLLLILVYIIIRFEIWSGLAAIIALAHDVIIMFALTVIFHIQINSAFIAAMITIVSYSINNTIVVFDRVREDQKLSSKIQLGAMIDNNRITDGAVKETLSRSINSTVTTMVAIVIFAILGASSVREFALPVIFGLISGFYSSLVIAPSLYCLMKNEADKRKAIKKGIIDSDKTKKVKYAGM